MAQTQRRLYYRATGKLMSLIGKGGINCPCCTIAPKSITKKYWSSLNRRRLSRELVKEVVLDCDRFEPGPKTMGSKGDTCKACGNSRRLGLCDCAAFEQYVEARTEYKEAV